MTAEDLMDKKTLDITIMMSSIATEEEFRDMAKELLVLISTRPYENAQTTWNPDEHSLHIYVEFPEEHAEAQEMVMAAIDRISRESDDAGDTLHDERFGTFFWNEYGGWETEVELNEDAAIDLHIEADEPSHDVADSLIRARAIIANLAMQESRWRTAAADNLLENYNQNWNEAEPIDHNTFIGNLSLSSLRFERDGGYSAWYFTNEMFTDHDIVIYCGIDGRILDVSVEG